MTNSKFATKRYIIKASRQLNVWRFVPMAMFHRQTFGSRWVFIILSTLAILIIQTGAVIEGQETDKIPFQLPALKPVAIQPKAGSSLVWKTMETRFAKIFYQTLRDLKRLERSIDYGGGGTSLLGIIPFTNGANPTSALSTKVDALAERVQEILDMRMRMGKVAIRVYSDKKQLHEAYYRLMGTACEVRAWYVFEENTMYINADDVHEGILAHEMAHAIIDHYFAVRPPKATAEILARYVDQHLYH